MKRLVTGASGQLGRQRHARAGAHVLGPLDHGGLDITDLGHVRAAVQAHRSDVVINAAAYNLVDRAQSEHLTAFANALGPRTLARVREVTYVLARESDHTPEIRRAANGRG